MTAFRSSIILAGIALVTVSGGDTLADQQTQIERTMSNPKADCEALMNAVLPFATQMLNRHGEFYPYGAAREQDGKITQVASGSDQEHPQSSDVIKGLKEAFVAEARSGRYKATALVYDVRTTVPSTGEKSDAIAVSLNHLDHYSVIVLLPYKIENGAVVVGTAFAQKGDGDIFPAQ